MSCKATSELKSVSNKTSFDTLIKYQQHLDNYQQILLYMIMQFTAHKNTTINEISMTVHFPRFLHDLRSMFLFMPLKSSSGNR